MDTLDAIRLFYSLSFLVLIALAFVRMFYRLGLYFFSLRPTPLLLRRDLILFGAVVLVSGLNRILQFFGVDNLSDEPVWVVISGGLIVAGLAYWVWIEYFRIGIIKPPH